MRSRQLSQRFAATAEQLASNDCLRLLAIGIGQDSTSLASDVFPMVIEASRRAHGQTHYPVQVAGGLALIRNRIIEMQTGEGKTLTAILPIALRAIFGKGCHVLTANDYLAERDADFARPILEQLGLSVGCVQSGLDDNHRRAAYLCDVTYGTGSEMGFDFLRDRMRMGPTAENGHAPRRNYKRNDTIQRGHYFALVDEADNLLIDDASTPLLIGLETEESDARKAMYEWADHAASELLPCADFQFDPDRRVAYLTDQGHRAIALRSKPTSLDSNSMEDIFEQVETSLLAHHAFRRDRDYLVDSNGVTIISESTGRQLAGRKWQRGLHFAVEAKERVPFSAGTGTAARISVQAYFAKYENLAGMTGTAWHARREFKRYYRSRVKVIPTHRPCIRTKRPASVFASMEAKNEFLASDIKRLVAARRSVLVGTPSVDASELLSETLANAGIEHVVLNAVQHEREAEIVAEAGEVGRVTIATNMAGRGTDIKLSEKVRQAGGLHVIATEMHSSPRIDRQLIGRAARQGDPGSYQFCLSLDDELFRHSPGLQAKLLRRGRGSRTGGLPSGWARYFHRIQRQVELTNIKQRKRNHKSEKQRLEDARATGLDPHLEIVDDE